MKATATHSRAATARVRAVPVPRAPKESGTITKSEEAGVRQERVRRVPPTTPMERVSRGLLVSSNVSVMRFRSSCVCWRGGVSPPGDTAVR
ncbi:hypothetical protein ADL27_10545 [Streptomyces sp. NRRL F-6602]|nr:hypothetical protein ADL27_10545 [Streptomyces sp. NRRL F-6602]